MKERLGSRTSVKDRLGARDSVKDRLGPRINTRKSGRRAYKPKHKEKAINGPRDMEIDHETTGEVEKVKQD